MQALWVLRLCLYRGVKNMKIMFHVVPGVIIIVIIVIIVIIAIIVVVAASVITIIATIIAISATIVSIILVMTLRDPLAAPVGTPSQVPLQRIGP